MGVSGTKLARLKSWSGAGQPALGWARLPGGERAAEGRLRGTQSGAPSGGRGRGQRAAFPAPLGVTDEAQSGLTFDATPACWGR